MIKVSVNGQGCQIEEGASLRQVLFWLGYDPVAVAVAVNGVVITKKCYDIQGVEKGDALDVVAPMQGG